MPDLALDLRYLRYAMTAAEQGSLRRAANVLDIQQSTLSRRIRLLEHRLGFALFDRDPRGIRLTSAGESFLKEAALGVDHFDRAVQLAFSIHRGDRGELHIGILASLTSGFLHSVLRQYREMNDGVTVRIHEGAALENLHRLSSGQLDVCFITGEPEIPGYSTALLWRECMFIALPSDHRLATKEEVTWEEIRGEAFIVSNRGVGPEILSFLVRRFADLGFRPRIDVQEVSRESLMNLVAIGYGLTLTSTSSLAKGISGVVFRPIAGNCDNLPSSAVWSLRNSNPALTRLLRLAKSIAKRQTDEMTCAAPVAGHHQSKHATSGPSCLG